MGGKRYSTEQIIVKLREAEIETWSEPLVRTKESESRRLCGSPVCTSKRAMKPTAPALRASSASMRSDSWRSRASTL